jgi:hypothetical protein
MQAIENAASRGTFYLLLRQPDSDPDMHVIQIDSRLLR